MHKVNEELIGKDSVKKHFLEAQTFATDEPTTPLPPFGKGDEGVGLRPSVVDKEGPGVGNDDEDNLESPDSQRPIEARSLPQNHAGEEEIIDDEDVKPLNAVEYPHQSATNVARAGKRKGDNRGETSFPQAGRRPVDPASIKPQSMPSNEVEGLPSNEVEGWMGNLELILDIPLQIDVQIGQTKIPLREVLELSSGSIIKLNKSESDSVDLLINGKLVAEGQIVLTDQNTLGIQVTSIVNRVERIRSLR